MRKQFTFLLIIVFILGLVPINFSTAITQNQIDAEVQIVCTDGSGNWFSGSGTIIDPKGIILTNRHVIEGAYMNTCFIGFIESISQEPNFGTEGNYNLAEVKYYTSTNDMDAAILYLDNPTNKSYSYINIWDSNSDTLQFGDKVEAIGFPSIGGSTITYTSGDFSGFGSNSDGTQNYIKSTAQLEHGNSGGASYNSAGQFIGIPTMVVAGTLNSLSYILSVNSIKNWLSGILGNEYQQEVIEQEPSPVKPTVSIQDDITPPKIENAPRSVFSYIPYNKNGERVEGLYYGSLLNEFSDLYSINSFNKIQIAMVKEQYQWDISDMDNGSGVKSVYYSYSDKLDELNLLGTEYIIKDVASNSSISELTPVITLPDITDTYYIGIRFKDNSGNISNLYVLTYVYEKDNFLELKNIKFYSDPDYKNMIGNYDFEMESWDEYIYPQYHQYCVTNKKEIYIKWQYENNYSKYAVAHYNEEVGEMSASESLIKGNIETTNDNKYKVTNLDKATENNEYYGYNICENSSDTWCHTTGKITSLLLKPITTDDDPNFEGKHVVVKFAYNPNYSSDIKCGANDISRGTNSFGHLYIVLKDTKPLVEDSSNSNNVIDINFANKLKGQILLQVEQNGEAYYVYPEDNKRYYLGRPADAFNVMRELGLGATHQFINSYTIYPNHVLGKILIDVEQNGEAYYIYPKDKKAYYLGRPADAFRIMRELGLGITNTDIRKIDVGEIN